MHKILFGAVLKKKDGMPPNFENDSKSLQKAKSYTVNGGGIAVKEGVWNGRGVAEDDDGG